MILKDIIERCSTLTIAEVRTSSENSYELVFFTQEVDEWNNLLSEMLGPPIKPKGVKPTSQHNEITKEYGGIFTDQTLFKKDILSGSLLAMFWPWQDNIHTTLNIVCVKK